MRETPTWRIPFGVVSLFIGLMIYGVVIARYAPGIIGDDDIDFSSDVVNRHVANVESLHHGDALVITNLGVQLTVPNIKRNNMGCSALQHAIGKSTG